MPDDGVFNISQTSNHNVDNDVESNDSQVNLKDDDNGNGEFRPATMYLLCYFFGSYWL